MIFPSLGRLSTVGLLVAALMAGSVRLLGADYTLQVMVGQYANQDHAQGANSTTRICCKGLSISNCTDACHNQFLFCLRPTGDDSGCPLGNHTTPVIPSDVISFNSPSSMYYMGPLQFNGTRWTGSVQLYIKVVDVEVAGSDLVTEFFVSITIEPGTEFTTGDTALGLHSGTAPNTFIALMYRVLCLEDYFGLNCIKFCQETNNDMGHYTCDGNGDITCMEGYDDPSTNCTIDLYPCNHTTPCLNGGTCSTTGPDEYVCECVNEFEGENCQLNRTDECVPDPCQNGATCVDQLSDYTCQCVDGYEGKNCDIDVDDCQPNPCLNGGTCNDLLLDYMCVCPTGYTGKNCSEASAEDTGSQSGSSGLSAARIAGWVVAGIAVLALIIVVLVIVIVVVLRRRKTSAKVNLQGDQDVYEKRNEAYGTSSVAPIPLAVNQAYRTVQHSAPPEDEGYVVNQLTYDLPHTTTAPTIATAPNAAYGGVQRPTDESGDAYDYIAPSQLL